MIKSFKKLLAIILLLIFNSSYIVNLATYGCAIPLNRGGVLLNFNPEDIDNILIFLNHADDLVRGQAYSFVCKNLFNILKSHPDHVDDLKSQLTVTAESFGLNFAISGFLSLSCKILINDPTIYYSLPGYHDYIKDRENPTLLDLILIYSYYSSPENENPDAHETLNIELINLGVDPETFMRISNPFTKYCEAYYKNFGRNPAYHFYKGWVV